MSAGSDEGDERHAWLTRLRAEWFRALRPMGSWVPWELRALVSLDDTGDESSFWNRGVLKEPPPLGDTHLRHCAVLPDRLALLGRLPGAGIVAEVGTSHGDFARDILRIAQPRELHLIDHEIQPAVLELSLEPSAVGRVHVHHRDSADALEEFDDGYFDWIYIDAQHAYEGVTRDINVARRKVKEDGLLVFNDYILWSYVEMEPYGVVAAVNELCLGDHWELVYLTLPPHMYCDAAVRRMRRAA